MDQEITIFLHKSFRTVLGSLSLFKLDCEIIQQFGEQLDNILSNSVSLCLFVFPILTSIALKSIFDFCNALTNKINLCELNYDLGSKLFKLLFPRQVINNST